MYSLAHKRPFPNISFWKQLLAFPFIASLLMTLFSFPLGGYARVQSPDHNFWSSPINISQTPGSSLWPFLIADQTGTLHLFWAEDLNGNVLEEGLTAGNAIMYRRNEDSVWSEPIDVLVTPGGGYAAAPRAAIDSYGILHLVWAGRDGLYYSRVDTAYAGNPHSWSNPVRMTFQQPLDQYPITIAVDRDNILHIVYASSEEMAEILHIASNDGGVSWSDPVEISAGMESHRPLHTLVSGGVSLVVDQNNRLHVGWTMYGNQGYGQVIFYARSLDGGTTWNEPFLVDEKLDTDYEKDWIAISLTGPDTVHLAWVGRDRVPGRSYRFSADGGRTWSPIEDLMDGYRGENRTISMVTDISNTIHLFSSARTGGNDTLVRYLTWQKGEWGPVSPVDLETAGQHAVVADIVSGNRLVIAWEEFTTGEINFAETVLELPQLPGHPYTDRPVSLVTATPEPGMRVTAVPVLAEASPTIFMVTRENETRQDSKLFPIFWGIIPTLFVVTVVLGIFLWKRI